MGCGCSSGPIVVPRTAVFSRRSDATWTSVTLTEPVSGADIARVMLEMDLSAITANAQVKGIYLYGNDLSTWTEADLGEQQTTKTVYRLSGALEPALFYRFGVTIKNASGQTTRCESAHVSMVITPSSF